VKFLWFDMGLINFNFYCIYPIVGFSDEKKGRYSMLMPSKVKISIELFNKVIEFLESLVDVEDMPPETLQLYGYVYYALKDKKASTVRNEVFLHCFDNNEERLRFSHDLVNSLMYGGDIPF
jgi:hypothetical protein